MYGSGKSSVAAEIAYRLGQRRQPYALLDLDYLGWGGTSFGDRGAWFGLMLRNLASVAANYRDAGVGVFVVASFVRSHDELHGVRDAAGVPLRVVRLAVTGARLAVTGARLAVTGARLAVTGARLAVTGLDGPPGLRQPGRDADRAIGRGHGLAA